MHPDTVRYWERKAWIDLRDWAPDPLLRALGKDDLIQRHSDPAIPMVGAFSHIMHAWGGAFADNANHAQRQPGSARTRKGARSRAMAINGKGRCFAVA